MFPYFDSQRIDICSAEAFFANLFPDLKFIPINKNNNNVSSFLQCLWGIQRRCLIMALKKTTLSKKPFNNTFSTPITGQNEIQKVVNKKSFYFLKNIIS